MSPGLSVGLGYAVALAAGAAMALAFAPFALATLAIVGLAAIFYLIANGGGRRLASLGYVFGLAYVGLGVYWIFVSVSRFGGGPLAASVVTPVFIALFALYPVLALWLGWRLSHRRPVWAALAAFPLTWVAMEWVRSWLFTGTTWLVVGYSQIDRPVAGLAPILGTFGLSLVVALLAGALAAVAMQPSRARMAWLAIMLVVYTGSGLLDGIDWTRADGDPLAVAMIQGNIPPDQKWREDERVATLRYYTERSREHFGKPLIIWPETAVPAFYRRVKDEWLDPLAVEAGRAGSSVVTGVPLIGADRTPYNAVMALDRPERVYRKRHLVPFGEYVPFRGWLGGALNFVGAPLGDFGAGTDATLIRAGGQRIGVSVCYEVTFGDEVADTVPAAGLLLNVSNDGWFGDSSAPYQHLQMSRMRALETGRSMLRATNTGITAVIAADGAIQRQAPMFQRTVLTGEIQPRAGATPYARWEDWPIVGCLAAALVVLGVAARRARKPEAR